ncbi:hypothetical protein [uncultured Treponema sp.]|uniref:hypothetical protein n=1 Tax=uncultured Treponema sp. TaxID=162155 RepID=UPI0028E7BB61|nr:hypothetical protein [uncultured Treponema sp.]
MQAQIQTLLNGKDNIEKIRDAIALILKNELSNQYALAETAGIESLEDFNIGVYLESARPWELTENEVGGNPFPLVNILLNEMRRVEGKAGSAIGRKRYTASFSIDCYACGNAESDGDDARQAALKAWRIAGIVRSILMSGFYAYLGMRGVVLERDMPGIKTGIPSNLAESAAAVTVARIDFSVSFYEDSPQGDGAELEEIQFEVVGKTGEVLIRI